MRGLSCYTMMILMRTATLGLSVATSSRSNSARRRNHGGRLALLFSVLIALAMLSDACDLERATKVELFK